CAWLICAVLAGVMMLAWPPDRALRGAGWAVAVALLATEVIAALKAGRRSDTSLALLLSLSWGVIAGLGLLDWLSGAGGEYTTLIVLPLVYVAASQAPRRVAVTLLIAPAALLPGLAQHHLASHALAADLVTIVLWLCLAGMA